MLKQYSDNMQKSMKDLLSINAGALEQFSQQQTELFTGLISDSISYAASLSKQNEYKGWLNASHAYTESVRTRMLKTAKASYATLSSTKEKTTELLTADMANKANAKPAAPAVTPTKKAAPTKKSTPVKKVAPKTEAGKAKATPATPRKTAASKTKSENE
ncbi:hypothetical protein DRW07_18165 [Alteromonas sediminis]|uniref:Phasin domain-containing protein n=1 Tax=Alteromonas sediminis TaxID=2259342 RepID=A0A3N5Y464_9ALTE|nr:phasin family protein [Alteromonas sediminis]RPJ64849.1 hypothetical protein DRW07_18165 [Alteromonas sediminis]